MLNCTLCLRQTELWIACVHSGVYTDKLMINFNQFGSIFNSEFKKVWTSNIDLVKLMLSILASATALLPERGECEAIEMSVSLPRPPSPEQMYYPNCVKGIKQCAGCCGHDILKCVPTQLSQVIVGPVNI